MSEPEPTLARTAVRPPPAPSERRRPPAASPSLRQPPTADTSAAYRRYRIPTQPTPDIVPHPHRFEVSVRRLGLARLLLTELLHYRFDRSVVLSRPCVYGVFGGPVGGFAPRSELCVGCLRCTTQYPEMVEVRPNPDRAALGDHYVSPDVVDRVLEEARGGQVPVRGAGYRGRFGGRGWDGMWTDFSEIVRPTRDGIHGREFISTVVDIGPRPTHLQFTDDGRPLDAPLPLSLPLPLLLELPPATARSTRLLEALAAAAATAETLAVVPIGALRETRRPVLRGGHVVPEVTPADADALSGLGYSPRMVTLSTWDRTLLRAVEARWPDAVVSLRVPLGAETVDEIETAYGAGVRVFQPTANLHGRGTDGRFVRDLICDVHDALVARGRRDAVTLIGSGGIAMAEHVPKAVLCGLDAVALDLPVLVALQARFDADTQDRRRGTFRLPAPEDGWNVGWGAQRVLNLLAAWRDQLLEVMGAMGLREVRRMRGERGRAMLQRDLEAEAFAGIAGFEPRSASNGQEALASSAHEAPASSTSEASASSAPDQKGACARS